MFVVGGCFFFTEYLLGKKKNPYSIEYIPAMPSLPQQSSVSTVVKVMASVQFGNDDFVRDITENMFGNEQTSFLLVA